LEFSLECNRDVVEAEAARINEEREQTESEDLNALLGNAEAIESVDSQNDSKESPVISLKEALKGLEVFIIFYEQKDNGDFDVGDLRTFRKHKSH
ncbi:123_t:CDS:2, partial [Paraglomus brasilianum]